MMRQGICVFLLLLAAGSGAASQQQPPRDPPPQPIEAPRLEKEIRARIASEGLTVKLALELARLQEERGVSDRAEATLLAARSAFPADVALARALAGLYNRLGRFAQTMQVMEEAAALQPNDPAGYYTAATYYEEKIRRDSKLAEADKLAYIHKGIEALDQALALNPDYVEALVYKNILLRHQMRVEPDRGRQQMLEQQANELRNRAMELQRLRPPADPAVRAAAAPPPPPPPSRRPCIGEGSPVTTRAPVRVGGNIKAPAKTQDARPVYPAEAMNARIQGVVIIEATIAEDGTVAGACVLRSIPYLDDAALDAVSQWRFTPTLLNGAPVPVIMTVTVNFTLE